jgi:predicted nucleic acid-binding protein
VRRPARGEAVTHRPVRSLRCAPLGLSEGIRAGRWRRQFAERGITRHQAACVIAATTAGINARLATGPHGGPPRAKSL